MNDIKQDEIGFIFIHGAGLRSSIWQPVVEKFKYPYLLIEFPFHDADIPKRSKLSLEHYIHCVKSQFNKWDIKRVVIVAHSIGGIFAQILAKDFPDRVCGIAAVGAVIPRIGGSFVSSLPFPNRYLMPIILRMAGTRPPESAIRRGLCNDLTKEQADDVIRGFIPEAIGIFTDKLRVEGLPDVPKLYVKLENDHELSTSIQDKMINNFQPHRVETLNTGHLPMISNPDGLRSIIEGFIL
ncbi:alpha/beta fold hydrolase [Paenibacillus gansuensis]|uniref:Alpha/beta fold hydrolase n=1 Tax=Paenibacillus gansuensis TaxID=306542 RepID=A0ABW5PFL4_9BACL